MTSIPLFPLNTVLFPDGYLPLQVFEVRYLDMVKKCIASGQPFGVVPLLAGSEVRLPEAHEQLADAGTMARIVECSAPLPGLAIEQKLRLLCQDSPLLRLELVADVLAESGMFE